MRKFKDGVDKMEQKRKYHYEYDLKKADFMVKAGFKIIGTGYSNKGDGNGYVVFVITPTFYPHYNTYKK